MPAGAGICPACNRGRWLRAGPVTTVCDECEDARLLHRAELAISPAAQADPAEAMLNGDIQ